MSEQIDGLCFCSFTINSGNKSSKKKKKIWNIFYASTVSVVIFQ